MHAVVMRTAVHVSSISVGLLLQYNGALVCLCAEASPTDIQGDSGVICNTLGNDSMCDYKQKSSYEHVSDFRQLQSYDRLKLRIEGNDY